MSSPPSDDNPWYDADWGLIAAVISIVLLTAITAALLIVFGRPALAAEATTTPTIRSATYTPAPTRTATRSRPTATPTASTPPATRTPIFAAGSTTAPSLTNTPMPDDVQAHLDEAQQLYEAYQIAAAAAIYTEILEEYPDNVEALLGRARTGSFARDEMMVLGDLMRAMILDPDNVDVLLAGNDWALSAYDYNSAATYLGQALDLEPDNPEVLLALAHLYAELGSYRDVVTYTTRAIEIDPTCAVAYNNRGAAYSWLRQDDLALADFAHALELDPSFGVALVNRARVEARHGDLQAALNDIEAAKQIEPRDPDVYWHIAGFYSDKMMDYASAVEAYTTAIELSPEDLAYYGRRCDAYGKLGQYDRALSDCRYLIDHAPNFIYSYDHLGHLYLRMGEWQSARDTFDQIIQMGGYTHAYWHRGYAEYRLGNYTAARDDLDQALSITNFSGYHYDRALLYLQAWQADDAFAEFDMAFSIDPGYLEGTQLELPYRASPESDVMNYLGWGRYYEVQGDLDAARENYQAFLDAYGERDTLYEAIEVYLDQLG